MCQLITLGSSIKFAAMSIGLAEQTIRSWVDKGKKGHELFAEFSRDFEAAKRRSASYLLTKINRAADKDWKAAAWLLERRYPGEFGRISKTEYLALRRFEEMGEQAKDPYEVLNRARMIYGAPQLTREEYGEYIKKAGRISETLFKQADEEEEDEELMN